jgi:hypothetical protein
MSWWSWPSFLIGLAGGVAFMMLSIFIGIVVGDSAKLRDYRGR